MAGLLTAVFEAYDAKLEQHARIEKEDRHQPDAFARTVPVSTDAVKAHRVWTGLGKRSSAEAQQRFYYCFLSENAGIENVLLAYARHVFASKENVEQDYAYAPVLEVTQLARKVWREKHRMEAFVRFQLLRDGLWYAAVDPDHNVLPLIAPHFKSRYADKPWLIYDLRRRYGIHYHPETETVSEVQLEWQEGTNAAKPDATVLEPDEAMYQQLWKDYFKHTGIPARKNMQLHLKHIPARYWRHLTEKKP